MTSQQRKRLRYELQSDGFERTRTTRERSEGCYTEVWKRGKDTVMIVWGPRERVVPWQPDRSGAAYQDGYKTGLTWTNDWHPGGPWQYHASEHHSAEQKAKAAASQLAHREWMAGFKEGYAKNPKKTITR